MERNKDAPRLAVGELGQGNGQAANLEVDHEYRSVLEPFIHGAPVFCMSGFAL